MEKLSFNNIKNDASQDACGLYFLRNFMNDFMYRPNTLLCEGKNQDQKDFEKYLIDKKIIVVDYARVVNNEKYFNTLSYYVNSTNRTTILYSCKDLSYISKTCVLYKYNIPKNPTTKQLENIYKYLIEHKECDRTCFICCKNDTFYFCFNCGQYFCRLCVYTNLKVVDWRDDDIYYIICKSCSQHYILYTIPSYHTPF